jgi:hypothetical protein
MIVEGPYKLHYENAKIVAKGVTPQHERMTITIMI